MAVSALLVVTSVAQAAKPIAPKLTATSPTSSQQSPAFTITPTVVGEAEPEGGANTTGVKGLVGSSGIVLAAGGKPTLHPEYEIVIHQGGGCVGPVVGSGSAEALEAAGIAVTVPANTETALSAEQIDQLDSGNPSGCSGSLFYWEGNVPSAGGASGGSSGGGAQSGSGQASGGPGDSAVEPAVTAGKPAAPRLRLSPKAVANYNSPVVAGSAPGAGTVILYANGTCGGAPIARGSAAQLSSGFPVQVADNTATAFSAVAVGGQRSDCSSPVTYTEDSTAPLTRVTMGPGVKTRKRKVVFRFADVMPDPPGTAFSCKVGKSRWRACASPLRLNHLRYGRHVLRIHAVDLAGNAERVGAKRIFTVVPAS